MSVARPAASAPWLRVAAYACLAAVAIACPLVLSEVRPDFLSMSYGVSFLPYELLGFTGGVAILAAGIFELRRRRAGDVASRVAVAVPCLLALHFVTLTSEYAQRRFDYDCYEYAGRALLAGESPYRVGLIYLYPPLTAQSSRRPTRGPHGSARASASPGIAMRSGTASSTSTSARRCCCCWGPTSCCCDWGETWAFYRAGRRS